MKLEKKYISKENWKRVIEKEEIYRLFRYREIEGEASLLKIKKVKEPLCKNYDGLNVKLADNGYYWLQLAISDKNYWITAMYDNNKNLIQYYIDITKENVIEKNGKSYFYDMFLDIVQLSDGSIFLLDEDEFLEALNNKLIDKSDYTLAYNEANKIKKQLEKNNFETIKICEIYFEKLLSELEKKEDSIN